jgi:hypothetical protein
MTIIDLPSLATVNGNPFLEVVRSSSTDQIRPAEISDAATLPMPAAPRPKAPEVRSSAILIGSSIAVPRIQCHSRRRRRRRCHRCSRRNQLRHPHHRRDATDDEWDYVNDGWPWGQDSRPQNPFDCSGCTYRT